VRLRGKVVVGKEFTRMYQGLSIELQSPIYIQKSRLANILTMDESRV
jgi:hypothetical protein